MSPGATWVAALATLALLALYELGVGLAHCWRPQRMARTAHASLREEWFAAVSAQPGSEILAVQTLRNSLMSATMTASTAVLGLMGTVTLAAPSLHASLGEAQAGAFHLTPRLALELMLLALLFASLAASAMAVRYYNHVGFIAAMPVGSPARSTAGACGTWCWWRRCSPRCCTRRRGRRRRWQWSPCSRSASTASAAARRARPAERASQRAASGTRRSEGLISASGPSSIATCVQTARHSVATRSLCSR